MSEKKKCKRCKRFSENMYGKICARCKFKGTSKHINKRKRFPRRPAFLDFCLMISLYFGHYPI